MDEILFVKTSSLGDIVHHMPAVTDARRGLPHARLSWVVEEAYAPLARLHPAIDEVIPVASRRWRKRPLDAGTWREIRKFRGAVRQRRYDAVVDTQGLLRSALVASIARGPRHGYDMSSIREPLASTLYQVRHRVDWQAHAIRRNRALCGLALGYEPAQKLDFGLDRKLLAGPDRNSYAMLIHGTAQAVKEWDVAHWVAIAREVLNRNLDVVLPWGNEAERCRSEAIAAALPADGRRVRVPDLRPLDEVAALIAGARLVIGVDTGLVHVAAALGVPLIAIFLGSEPGLTGPLGSGPIEVTGGNGLAPAPAHVLAALDRLMAEAA